jgi:hypothetical protein
MTHRTVLGGTVNNGSRVSATFSFYQGEVGVRDRGGIFDVSFFATSTPVIPRKMEGILDGKLVKILSVDDRHLAANGQPPRDGEVRIVTLCVAPATPA